MGGGGGGGGGGEPERECMHVHAGHRAVACT